MTIENPTLVARALSAYRSGKFNLAITLLEELLEKSPNDAATLKLCGIATAQAGFVDRARTLLRKSSLINPNDAETLYNLASIELRLGNLPDAINFFESLLRIEPSNYDVRLNLAEALRGTGDRGGAQRQLDIAMKVRPQNPDALWLQALLFFDAKQYLQSVKVLRDLVSQQPDRPKLYLLLGICLTELNKSNEALAAFEFAIRFDPNDAEAHANRALLLIKQKRFPDAIDHFRQAAKIQPDNVDHLLNLGLALKESGDATAALEQFNKATKLSPDLALGYYNAAIACHELDRLADARAFNDKALQADPNLVVAHVNRGAFCQLAKDFSGAKVSYERALALEPANAGAEWNLALLELGEGNFERGFELYESRLRNNALASLYTDEIPFPRWDGAPVPAGSRILVLHEQGLGDTIQYARYLRLMGQRGIRVTVLAPRPLHRLLRGLPGVESVHDTLSGKLSFDYFCYIMSLAGIFETRLDAVTFGNEPYLTADPQLIEKWRSILPKFATGRGIGLMWSGGNISKIRGRSMSLPALSGLLQSSHEFVSLQKDLSEADAKLVAELPNLRHYGAQQEDFADAAAIIANLDLVITVDTSIAHLSGALGKETWVMVPFSADWRWLENRDDSPWYPNMRIFRQRTSGQWQPVVEEILAALANRYRAI